MLDVKTEKAIAKAQLAVTTGYINNSKISKELQLNYLYEIAALVDQKIIELEAIPEHNNPNNVKI